MNKKQGKIVSKIRRREIRIFLLVFLFPCVILAQTEDTASAFPPLPPLGSKETNQKCYHNGNLTVKERQSIYPFNKASIIKIISFPSSYQKDIKIIEDEKLNTSLVTEEFTLSEKQINRLTDILYNYNYSRKTKVIMQTTSTCGCLYMKHAILFMDDETHIMAHIVVDFIERYIETDLPSESTGAFCDGKYDLLKSFFKNVGLKQFDIKVQEEPKLIIEEVK